MAERCVFVDCVEFKDPTLPKDRGEGGECFANKGKAMKNCCFDAAKDLILSDQGEIVIMAIDDIRGTEAASKPKINGLIAAVNSYSHKI